MFDEEHWRYTLLIWVGVTLATAVALAGLGWLLTTGLRFLIADGHPLLAALCMGGSLLSIPTAALLLLRPLVRRLDDRPHVQRSLWLGALTVLMALTPLMMVWMAWLVLRGGS
ncbi:MAG: hypothetical protein HC822_12645 [Oscillochloris sp.]|nr:hypothetical protein [Oscillochloris sp.]